MAADYSVRVLMKREGEIFVGDLLVDEPVPDGFLGIRLGATVKPVGWYSHPEKPVVHIPIMDINLVIEEKVKFGTQQRDWFGADGMPKMPRL